MNHWHFILAAYAVTLFGIVGTALLSWRSMRRAERAVEELRK